MDHQSFSVATFNLYNLQLPGQMNPGQKPWTEAEFARKVAWIARQLNALDADIVGLQELWHADAMAACCAAGARRRLRPARRPPTGRGSSAPRSCARACSAATRDGSTTSPMRSGSSPRPDGPQAPDDHGSIPGFSRPVLNFQVALRDEPPLTEVFVAHLKSKLPTRIDDEPWFNADPATFKPPRTALGAALSTIRRTAEATALRVLLTGVMKGTVTPVIVLGDVNDGQHSNTSTSSPSSRTTSSATRRGGADIGLYTAQTLQEYRDTRDVYYTHVHQDLRESLDHVLVSEQFYDHSRRRLWLFDGLTINNDHLNDEDHRATGTGDHGVVKVALPVETVRRPDRTT